MDAVVDGGGLIRPNIKLLIHHRYILLLRILRNILLILLRLLLSFFIFDYRCADVRMHIRPVPRDTHDILPSCTHLIHFTERITDSNTTINRAFKKLILGNGLVGEFFLLLEWFVFLRPKRIQIRIQMSVFFWIQEVFILLPLPLFLSSFRFIVEINASLLLRKIIGLIFWMRRWQ